VRIEAIVSLLLFGLLLITIGLGIEARNHEKAAQQAVTEAHTERSAVCGSTRIAATAVLYTFRTDVDSGVAQAQLLTTWMPYCAGERGEKLAREINDAILASIPRSRDHHPPPLDVERIRAALINFSQGD
jgi:hypothetical protein